MYEPEFVEHDVWFLNVQARAYCQQCSEQVSPLYREQVARLRELFSLVPPGLRPKLQWSGPDERVTKDPAEQTGCSEPRDRVSVASRASLARGR
jgi:hypothetical protein